MSDSHIYWSHTLISNQYSLRSQYLFVDLKYVGWAFETEMITTLKSTFFQIN